LDQILRIQQRVHNKGIVVDSAVVLVSSQNWSADGVLRNRDAGLILSNAEIAEYFERIFIDDWTQRANQKLVS
jgi:phosphatidylserine/phosphatidylglycerophosphate/cardiolipin synthase-like enzyme